MAPLQSLPPALERSTSPSTQGDLWTGHLLLANNPPASFEYKFIIADYSAPSADCCEWEAGSHNRRMDLEGRRSVTLCGSWFSTQTTGGTWTGWC